MDHLNRSSFIKKQASVLLCISLSFLFFFFSLKDPIITNIYQTNPHLLSEGSFGPFRWINLLSLLSLIIILPILLCTKKTYLKYIWIFIPLIFYLYTLYPGLVGGDGDEYLFQAFKGGIAHPGGYPVYLWMGKIMLFLTGNFIGAMNILSLLFSALTLCFLYYLMSKINIVSEARIISLLILAFNPIFWQFAIQSEVYNINAFFLTSLFVLLLWFDRSSYHDLLILIGLFFGLSLGVYFSNIILALPILIYICIASNQKSQNIFISIFYFIFGAVLGSLIPMLYIYFTSHHYPPLGSLYNPNTFQDFISYITGEQYRSQFILNINLITNKFLSHINIFIWGFLGLGCFLAGLSIKHYKSHMSTRYFLFLLLSLITNFIFTTLNPGFDFYTMTQTSLIVVSLGLGMGLNAFLKNKLNHIFIRTFIPLCIVMQIALSPYFKKHDNNILYKSRSILNSLPHNSILLASWWDSYTSLLCVRELESLRKDVSLFEMVNQRRYYRERGLFFSTTLKDLLDLSKSSRPVYILNADERIAEYYKLEREKLGLFKILDKKT